MRDVYRQWRPTPLYRARRLERALETPARIYYKYEGVSPTGSHKPNTAVAQAYYNKAEGVTRLTTETGAGQWGSALAFAGAVFGLEVRRVHGQGLVRPEAVPARSHRDVRRALSSPSPSEETNAGRAILAEHPDSHRQPRDRDLRGGRGGGPREDTKYSLGSVLNHVLMHQTVIGEEAQMQIDEAEDYPDVVIGCTGGGSNFSGLSFPFIGRALREESKIRVIAVEPAACPSLTKGTYAYDFGDTGHLTPLVKMHTLGSTFVPPPFHAGGLRYHGMAPMVSHLHELGLIEARAYSQTEVFAAGVEFARAEGIVPAPEANHAVKAAMDEAIRCSEEGVSKAILFNLCGHGHFDMQAYIDYAAGKLVDDEYSEDEVAMALAGAAVRRGLRARLHVDDAEHPREQEHVQPMITVATTTAASGRHAAVDERAHELATAADEDERDERERDAERQHDLTEHERAGRVDADRDDDQRGGHGDDPPDEERNPAPMKPCMTTWPASVPTLDEERPEASRAIPNRRSACAPR